MFERWPTARQIETVETDDGSIGIKTARGRVKAEFDDAVPIARQTGRPLREVISRAESDWKGKQSPANGDEK